MMLDILNNFKAQRRLEMDKMRRSLRDNESIPIPLDWNIMKEQTSTILRNNL